MDVSLSRAGASIYSSIRSCSTCSVLEEEQQVNVPDSEDGFSSTVRFPVSSFTHHCFSPLVQMPAHSEKDK